MTIVWRLFGPPQCLDTQPIGSIGKRETPVEAPQVSSGKSHTEIAYVTDADKKMLTRLSIQAFISTGSKVSIRGLQGFQWKHGQWNQSSRIFFQNGIVEDSLIMHWIIRMRFETDSDRQTIVTWTLLRVFCLQPKWHLSWCMLRPSQCESRVGRSQPVACSHDVEQTWWWMTETPQGAITGSRMTLCRCHLLAKKADYVPWLERTSRQVPQLFLEEMPMGVRCWDSAKHGRR
jgi:hypothetical protein